MAKMYFKKDDEEMCYDLATIKDQMRMDEIKELEVIEAEINIGDGTLYCKEYGTVGDKFDMECGRLCDGYKPRNGKSGICMHHRNTYSQTDKTKIITI